MSSVLNLRDFEEFPIDAMSESSEEGEDVTIRQSGRENVGHTVLSKEITRSLRLISSAEADGPGGHFVSRRCAFETSDVPAVEVVEKSREIGDLNTFDVDENFRRSAVSCPPTPKGKHKHVKASIRLVRSNSDASNGVVETLHSGDIEGFLGNFSNLESTLFRTVRLQYDSIPRTVVMVKKWRSESVTRAADQIARFLQAEHDIRVLVEPSCVNEFESCETWCAEEGVELHKFVDLMICLGGDGTILHGCTLFKKAIPPILAYSLGSLCFLAPFKNIDTLKEDFRKIIDGRSSITLRSRLLVNISCSGERESFLILNEVTAHRGEAANICKLDVYCNDVFVTTVQGDGIAIATSTGSTAYSLSAGGPIVHPQVPCILLTPICPHSLSFRPLILPEASVIKVVCPEDSRISPIVAFDGRLTRVLKPLDFITITTSKYPLATVNNDEISSDWFHSLADGLHWNVRRRQEGWPIVPLSESRV